MAGIYIHIPFCKTRCIYCDFYSTTRSELKSRYIHALCKELQMRKEYLRGEPVETVYFGGGTPSQLAEEDFREVFETIRKYYGMEHCREITLEANPDDLTEEYTAMLQQLPFNRISMGIQTFDDATLKLLNRRHDAGNAVKAFHILRESGVRNISIDLIFGISQLTDETWKDTIEKALELSPEHISAYQLSIEEGSALAKMVADGRYVEASEEQCRRQYDILCRCLGRSGYHHYEISNFAKPGFEAVHNSAYWRRAPYIGLGPGAHSLTGDIRSWNSQELPHRSTDGSPATYSRTSETLSPENIRVERIMLSLRTDKGLEAAELYSLADRAVINSLLSEGALEKQGGSIRIPESRLFTSDEILRELI